MGGLLHELVEPSGLRAGPPVSKGLAGPTSRNSGCLAGLSRGDVEFVSRALKPHGRAAVSVPVYYWVFAGEA